VTGADEDAITDTILIRASVERVRAYFTDPELLTAWLGQRAVLEPAAGGRFAVDVGAAQIRGEYVEVAPDRVVFTWGMAGSAELPPGSSTVEVTFAQTGEGTRVTLVHTGLAGEQARRHRAGWPEFLRLLGHLLDPRTHPAPGAPPAC